MFPATRHSVVASAGADDTDIRRTAFDTCVEVYWRPVRRYVQLKWRASPEDAEELTQAFFARAYEKNFFEPYDPARARFRTFLRTCIDGFVSNERQYSTRQKRGGGVARLSLDDLDHGHDAGLAVVHDFDRDFEQEWARSVFASAVERLRRAATTEARIRQLAAFTRYDIDAADRGEKLTYAELGAELQLSVTDVTNALHAARRDFRAHVLECLRDLTRSDEEFESEARRLLRRDVR